MRKKLRRRIKRLLLNIAFFLHKLPDLKQWLVVKLHDLAWKL